MFGQLSEWLWLDPLVLDWVLLDWLLLELVVPEPEDDEPPLAAFASVAPPPATAPTTTTVARAFAALLIGVHLLAPSLTGRVNPTLLRGAWHSAKKPVSPAPRDTPAR
jgi:hypothetical protein